MNLKSSQKNEENLTNEVVENSSYVFATSVIMKIGSLIFTIILARLLMPELFGLYSLALTIVLTIGTFADLGINSAIIRYISDSLKRDTYKNRMLAKSRFSFLFKFKFLLVILLSLILFLLSEVIAIHVFKKPELVNPLRFGSIYIFIISLQGAITSVFYSLKKVKYTIFSEIITQASRIVLVVLLFMFYKNVESVFVSLSLSLILSFVFAYLILRKKYSFLFIGKKVELEKKDKKRMLGFFAWTSVLNVSLVFFNNISTIMLGIFLASEFIGYYNVIFAIITTITVFVNFGGVLLPVFTQIKSVQTERAFKRVFNYLIIMILPIAILLGYIIIPVIRAIYGQIYVPVQYEQVIRITSILLSLISIELILTGVYSSVFQAKEKTKTLASCMVISTILTVIVGYLFLKIAIPLGQQYGLIALALAMILVRYGNLITLGILAKKQMNISPDFTSIYKPVIASAITILFLFLFATFFKLNLVSYLVSIFLGGGIYLSAIILMKSIKKEDFRAIKIFRRANVVNPTE
jgi:stage V sporulation protein B